MRFANVANCSCLMTAIFGWFELLGGHQAPLLIGKDQQMRRACIFVDGENFRHSLKHLFPSVSYRFSKGDYLPETDWHTFFTSIASRFDCELLRVYWYVIEHV